MTNVMGPPPPPPRNPNPATSSEHETSSSSQIDESATTPMKAPMGPPPPINPNPPNLSTEREQSEQQQGQTKETDGDSLAADEKKPPRAQAVKQSSVPYSIPEWGGPPCHRFSLEVLKNGAIINQFDVCDKGAYMFGHVDICDFVLEHPTISRFHAVLQFNRSGEAYLYDLGSTHGTFVNKNQVDKRVYVDLHVGDVIRFGCSTRLYVFQGPSELMPPEKDLNIIREAKARQEILDREASLRRARREASMADGISWGMGEDAVEEDEDDMDEITWQTYKGQLTEKQEKTREKVLKRLGKIAHMKKEIGSIRAKDIAQGGLTQGQQTQIARNEQRIAQLMEELENLEETLNESIRESLGARAGKVTRGKKKGTTEEEEEFSSDEDDFYDRTKKKPSAENESENQTIETADTLLDKKDTIMKEIEEKKELFSAENKKMDSEAAIDVEPGDSLDAYMSGLSSQLVHDRKAQLQQELSALQSELDRILYLLKIADPTGEVAKKRVLKSRGPKLEKSEKSKKNLPVEPKKKSEPVKPADVVSEHRPKTSDDVCEQTEKSADVFVEPSKKPKAEDEVSETAEEKTVVYAVVKPQWLGAVEDREKTKETKHETETINTINEPDDFVDYKDRKKVLANADNTKAKSDSGIEGAAPGLIIRKRKLVDGLAGESESADQSTSNGAELMAQDAVALLLKHSRGYHGDEDEKNYEIQEKTLADQHGKKKKKPKTVLGPEKPLFLGEKRDNDDSWVPPEGQSGDGRTSLNDRYGY